MKSQLCLCLVLASLLFLVMEVTSMPVMDSGCSSIVPSTNTGCRPMNSSEVRALSDRIISQLNRIQATMSTVFNHSSLADISNNELTYNHWRQGNSHQLDSSVAEDVIAASVNRLKCMVLVVVDITANESVRHLVDEEAPHFATEFQSILEDLNVLLKMKEYVLGARFTACTLPDATCTDFCVLKRAVQIKSVAFELSNLPTEVSRALRSRRLNN